MSNKEETHDTAENYNKKVFIMPHQKNGLFYTTEELYKYKIYSEKGNLFIRMNVLAKSF